MTYEVDRSSSSNFELIGAEELQSTKPTVGLEEKFQATKQGEGP
jgi:hypothetical protein